MTEKLQEHAKGAHDAKVTSGRDSETTSLTTDEENHCNVKAPYENSVLLISMKVNEVRANADSYVHGYGWPGARGN